MCPYNLLSSFIVSPMYMYLDYIITITLYISRFDTGARRNETYIFINFIFIISYPLYGFLRVQGISLCHFLNTTLHLLLCVRFVLKCSEEFTLLYSMFLIPGNLLVVSIYNKSSFIFYFIVLKILSVFLIFLMTCLSKTLTIGNTLAAILSLILILSFSFPSNIPIIYLDP